MNVERYGNLIEALLWISIALVLFRQAWQSAGRLRLVFALLSLSFVVFAITDVVESETGAWWRPLWLLALKSACVAGILAGFGWHYRTTQNLAESRNLDGQTSQERDE
jgi:hypothetical protein